MSLSPSPSIEEMYEYLDSWYESKTPEELQEIRERQVRIEMTPMPVTRCRTCGEVSLGHRLGCGMPACPKQPASLDVEHVYMNCHGQILREGIAFCWLPDPS